MTSPRCETLIAKLEKNRVKTRELFAALEPEQWPAMSSAQSAWSLHDLLAHFVSAEQMLLRMAQDIAGGGRGAPEGLDIDEENAKEQVRLGGQSPQELLDALDQARQQLIDWTGTLSDEQLDRVGNHPVLGQVSVETLIGLPAGHQLMHIRETPALRPAR